MKADNLLGIDQDENGRGIGIARFKKPHKYFKPGDLFVGERRNGCFIDMQGWGWSSKQNRIVGGKWGYQVRFCGSKRAMKSHDYMAAISALKGAGLSDEKVREQAPQRWRMSGAGHLRVIKWIPGLCFNRCEFPPQLRDEAWLRRLLVELSCGNMPLTREEATPSLASFQNTGA